MIRGGREEGRGAGEEAPRGEEGNLPSGETNRSQSARAARKIDALDMRSCSCRITCTCTRIYTRARARACALRWINHSPPRAGARPAVHTFVQVRSRIFRVSTHKSRPQHRSRWPTLGERKRTAEELIPPLPAPMPAPPVLLLLRSVLLGALACLPTSAG